MSHSRAVYLVHQEEDASSAVTKSSIIAETNITNGALGSIWSTKRASNRLLIIKEEIALARYSFLSFKKIHFSDAVFFCIMW